MRQEKPTRRLTLFIVFTAAATFAAVQATTHPAQAQRTGEKMSSTDCLACHSDPALAKDVDGKIVSLHVDEKPFGGSVHGSLDCTSCHSDVKAVPHDPAPAKVNCAECHQAAHDDYQKGLHAKAIEAGNQKAASCLACHGNAHYILSSSDQNSKTFRANIPATCGSCHGQKFVMEGSGVSAQPFFSYTEGVHGRAVAAGRTNAAICTDCHGTHDIRSAADAQSGIFKFNVPKTCGQCHQSIAAQFSQSIHGQSIERGNWSAPVCTDCHGIHLIKAHIDPASSVASQALARTTCAQCHEGVRLSQEFGIEGKRASSYLDSYHGLASKLGSEVVANCASCHGIHNILPSSDPKAQTNPINLVTTCGKCHPGASQNFALGRVHLNVPISQDLSSKATRWVKNVYVVLIVVVIGGMLVHNGLVWRKKAVAKKRDPDRTFVRLTLSQRTQHWLLLSSFIALVITGFALKYPDSWIALLLGSSETIRRFGHRVAAIILIASGLYHLWYIALTSEGRRALREMLPRRKDLGDLLDNFKYYLGLRSRGARLARFGYAEKAEYWAVVWGVIIMGLTGMMVWFKVEFFGYLPRWVIDAALAVHFYEAILATLSIVAWHFYHVIFDPEVYPINWAFWDGRVSESQYKHEHPLDSIRDQAEGASQARPGSQPSPASETTD